MKVKALGAFGPIAEVQLTPCSKQGQGLSLCTIEAPVTTMLRFYPLSAMEAAKSLDKYHLPLRDPPLHPHNHEKSSRALRPITINASLHR